jgi:hypothetical protein
MLLESLSRRKSEIRGGPVVVQPARMSAAMRLQLQQPEGKRNIISDAGLDTLLDHRKEVFAGHGVGWKSDRFSNNVIHS